MKENIVNMFIWALIIGLIISASVIGLVLVFLLLTSVYGAITVLIVFILMIGYSVGKENPLYKTKNNRKNKDHSHY